MITRSTIAAAVAVAAGALGLAGTAGAAEVTYVITNGTTGVNEHSCTRITNVFTTQDCTFGNTQTGLSPLGNPWIGPTRQGGYYELGSAGDDLTYNPNDANPTGPAGVLEPDNIKIPLRVVGTVVINDQGTASGTDDTVRFIFSLQGDTETSGVVRHIATGQNTKAIERWQSLDLTMTAPYTVNQALPNGSGGFDYIIGSRGTPTQLCRALNPGVDDTFDPNDCFPSNNFNKDTAQPQPPPWWAPRPAIGSVGIERGTRLADKPGPGNGAGPPVPNIGIATVGAFRGRVPGTNNAAYSCITNNGASDDCVNSPLMWGSSQEDPGLDNIVGIISTGTTGITRAELYWTQEYYIGAFGAPPPPGDNSFQAGIIRFTGIPQGTEPNALEDAFNVVQGTSNNVLNVLANDLNYPAPPATTVTITVPPNQGGTATANPNGTITYTPNASYTGVETFTYQAATTNGTDTAVVTMTVQADVNPVGGARAIAIDTRGRTGAATTLAIPSGDLGNLPSVVALTTTGNAAKGQCAISGGTSIRYTPTAAFINGGDSDTCNYSITDQDGDAVTGTVTITVTDVQPTLNGNAGEGRNDDDIIANTTFTAGNGPVTAHTLNVTTQGTNGSCVATATSATNVRVTYTADAGTSGADSCVVALVDADGDASPATFDFTVESSGISLPGGGSAIDPWSLLLLGGLPLLRRRRRD